MREPFESKAINPLLLSLPLYRADCSTTNGSRLENVTLRSTCYLSTNQRIGIYTGTTAAAILINFARTITFYFVCVNASRVLHNRMFAAVLRAPVLFFDTNPIGEQVSVFLSIWLSVVCLQHLSVVCYLSTSSSLPVSHLSVITDPPLLSLSLTTGRVLNRFSKDIGFLDDLLPYVFCEYLLVNPIVHSTITTLASRMFIFFQQLLLRCLAIVVTAVTINAWVVIPAFLLLSVFLAVRWYYLKTSRDIKRLEAVGGPSNEICVATLFRHFLILILSLSLFAPSSSQSSLLSHINHFTRAAHHQDI